VFLILCTNTNKVHQCWKNES